MASFVAKIISKKILGERLENNFGKEDPYFETVPATRLDGKPSSKKTKKRPKALPPGISEHDGKVLTKVKRRAYRLDMSLFSFAGIKFGWSSVIGIIPGAGDVLDAFMAMMVLRTCQQVEGGLPASVKSKMMFNIMLDFVIGIIPVIGDLADAVFRANTRNAVELEKYLREKGAKNLQSHGHSQHMVDPTDPEEFDRMQDEESRASPPRYTTATPSRQATQSHHNGNSQPGRQDVVPEQRSGGGWFSKSRQPDVEQGGSRGREDENRLSIEQPRRTKSTLQKNRS